MNSVSEALRNGVRRMTDSDSAWAPMDLNPHPSTLERGGNPEETEDRRGQQAWGPWP